MCIPPFLGVVISLFGSVSRLFIRSLNRSSCISFVSSFVIDSFIYVVPALFRSLVIPFSLESFLSLVCLFFM